MSFYQTDFLSQTLERIDKLQPGTAQRQWEKMDSAQMLNHLRLPLEVGMDRMELPNMFIMKIIGPAIRKKILSDKELSKNSPTAPNFVISGPWEFETEKQQLVTALNEFIEMGKAGKLQPRHKYFGKMDAADWDFFQRRHFDHHLSQFGV